MYYYGYNGSYGMNTNPCCSTPGYAGYTTGGYYWSIYSSCHHNWCRMDWLQ